MREWEPFALRTSMAPGAQGLGRDMSTCIFVQLRLAREYESSSMQDDVISELRRVAELHLGQLGLVSRE